MHNKTTISRYMQTKSRGRRLDSQENLCNSAILKGPLNTFIDTLNPLKNIFSSHRYIVKVNALMCLLRCFSTLI